MCTSVREREGERYWRARLWERGWEEGFGEVWLNSQRKKEREGLCVLWRCRYSKVVREMKFFILAFRRAPSNESILYRCELTFGGSWMTMSTTALTKKRKFVFKTRNEWMKNTIKVLRIGQIIKENKSLFWFRDNLGVKFEWSCEECF